MKFNENYELVLNHISMGESRFMDEERYEEYSHMAALWLNHQHKHLFQDEIMERYTTYKNFGELLKDKKHEYLPGMMVQRGDKREQVYYDICGMDIVEATDPFFPFFFACKLSHIDILHTDEFLNYHLQNSFENDTLKFFRFLTLVFRSSEKLLKPSIIETAKEWIAASGTKPEHQELESTRLKGRKFRESGDKKTTLNLAQTALLIKFMQQVGIILPEDELNYKQAGRAFEILTGYSMDTIRQNLGTKGELAGAKHEDYKELHEIITRLASLIETNVRKK